MATVDLVNERTGVITGNDNIVIKKVYDSIPGGRSLDVTGYSDTVIPAGHVIIKETATSEHKPMPVTKEGKIVTLGAITAGSGYTGAGTYEGVALTGGSGSGATADIVVAGGVVTSVTLVNQGTGYADGDLLSVDNANVGAAGSGFAIPVTEITEVSTGYDSLPSGHTYAGILIASILTAKPFAGIMVRGVVNPAASVLSLSSIQSAVSAALPHILFQED